MEKIIFNGEYIPEGIRKLKKVSAEKLFIFGRRFASETLSELNVFDIYPSGVITSELEILTREPAYSNPCIKYLTLDELRSKKSEAVTIVVGFSWLTNSELLRYLCEDPKISDIYILEGAEYSWTMMFSPERKLFKHQKISFIDSYYKGMSKRNLTYSYYLENKDAFSQTYDWLADDKSKRSMVHYLDGHINLTTFPMESEKDTSAQYFASDIIRLGKNEVFVDCGGYDGDTCREFFEQTNGMYSKIFAFEPDEKMISKFLKNTSGIDIEFFKAGVYDNSEGSYFDNSLCGTIVEKGTENTMIKTIRLDDCIKERVSFIKMDVEGAELKALIGGEVLIRAYKPTLAICVYHKREDLITIPQYIKSLVPEYRLYLRGYFDYNSELVMYAFIH